MQLVFASLPFLIILTFSCTLRTKSEIANNSRRERGKRFLRASFFFTVFSLPFDAGKYKLAAWLIDKRIFAGNQVMVELAQFKCGRNRKLGGKISLLLKIAVNYFPFRWTFLPSHFFVRGKEQSSHDLSNGKHFIENLTNVFLRLMN